LTAGVSVRGFLIEEMAPAGVEVLVGGVVDPVFGPAIVLGLGGIFAEVYDDITTRICPVSQRDVEEMIREIKAAPLLFGARGRPAVDVVALGRVVLAIGGAHGLLLEHAERISEIDLNPVIVSASGAVAVDARIILRPRENRGE
jgi:acetyl-CoA synthetase (ADP-forming)